MDWYPWGEEAFRRAREEDRPVLLSVGYSSCHWCHVMAHESFEDPAIAELQNRLFVSVKVDREERPDVDRVYMEALQALTGGGGWPMTVFLLPDSRPFYAGTYFPPVDRGGLPAFPRVMVAVAEAYQRRHQDAVASAERLAQALSPPAPAPEPRRTIGWGTLLARAEDRVLERVDHEFGGLGTAPKFPQWPLLDFLLLRAALAHSARAGETATGALRAMAQGGIHDQLGGGFHRYSVDRRWAVPHFEKMLYDNAQLIRTCVRSWQLNQDHLALALARRTADFLLTDLSLESGGFAASLDADSPDGEGAFYTFTESELDSALDGLPRQRAEELFGGPGPALTEEGRTVLRGGSHVPKGRAEPWGDDAGEPLRSQVLERLAHIRAARPRPTRDGKVIVGWNALTISALAELAVACDVPAYLARARSAMEAILGQASSRGEVMHLFDGAEARVSATLEDLTALGLAALALHEAEGDARWFDLGLELAQRVEREFASEDGGGWYDTKADHDPNLRFRPRSLEDGAVPSGGAQMAELCLRLAALTGDPGWRERAESVLGAMAVALERAPMACGAWLGAATLLAQAPVELALVAPAPGGHWSLLRQARSQLRPQVVVAVGQPGPGSEQAEAGPPLVRLRRWLEGRATAYVCRDFACHLPVTAADALEVQLEAAATGSEH